MPENNHESAYQCACPECIEQPTSKAAQLHTRINRLVATLDEKHRRQFVGLLASQYGYGGVEYYAVVTGLNRKTISRGKRELEQASGSADERIRASGGGRQRREKNTAVAECSGRDDGGSKCG